MNKEKNREKRYHFSAIENRMQEKLKSKWMKFDPRGTKEENAGRRREEPSKRRNEEAGSESERGIEIFNLKTLVKTGKIWSRLQYTQYLS